MTASKKLKFKLIGPKIKHIISGCYLRRIQSTITKQLGGLIENEYNLSQEGYCWIEKNAIAMGSSRVFDNAVLNDFAVVRDCAIVGGNANIGDQVIIRDNSVVSGNTSVWGNTIVSSMTRLINGGFIRSNDDYFYIEGFSYPITITTESISIGCKTYSPRKMSIMNIEEAINLGCRPNEFEPIQNLCKAAIKILKKRLKDGGK